MTKFICKTANVFHTQNVHTKFKSIDNFADATKIPQYYPRQWFLQILLKNVRFHMFRLHNFHIVRYISKTFTLTFFLQRSKATPSYTPQKHIYKVIFTLLKPNRYLKYNKKLGFCDPFCKNKLLNSFQRNCSFLGQKILSRN